MIEITCTAKEKKLLLYALSEGSACPIPHLYNIYQCPVDRNCEECIEHNIKFNITDSTYIIHYIEKAAMDIEVTASSEEEAEEIFQQMLNNGEVDFAELEPYDTDYTIEAKEMKE